MFQNATDRALVEQQLQALNTHPEEGRRLADLGDFPETLGQLLLAALQQGHVAAWLTADLDDPQRLTTDIHNPAALALERNIASGIGHSGGPSPYDALFVGGTTADAPRAANVIHINTMPEDMKFPALGPRILTDGATVPLPDLFLLRSEGYHIPFDLALTPGLIAELCRTLTNNGLLLYAPSTNVLDVVRLLQQVGFANVSIIGLAPRTVYRGRPTFPTQVVRAVRP